MNLAYRYAVAYDGGDLLLGLGIFAAFVLLIVVVDYFKGKK